jgi:hypothetical protein
MTLKRMIERLTENRFKEKSSRGVQIQSYVS